MQRRKRDKVFGSGRLVPLDRNAKVRVMAYARAYNARWRRVGHRRPLTGAYIDVLNALLWKFHNSRSGACFPSYERIAEAAGCARSTVAEAIKALEIAGVLTWQNRLIRVRALGRDLFGRPCPAVRILRTSNAYQLGAESENRTRTPNQESFGSESPPLAPALAAALASLGDFVAGGRYQDGLTGRGGG